ncbi:MAG TPA: hypothetical protein PK728_04820 [Bacillota bacterium]|nr:hypothetical protein [Bacillota bacterium]
MYSIQAMRDEIRREERMEVAAALSLLSYRDGKLFDNMKVKPHTPTLSKAVNTVLGQLSILEMRQCEGATAKVLEIVARYPSFRAILDTEKEKFKQHLQVYVARQLLLSKCRQGKIISPLAQRAAVVFLEMRLIETVVTASVNQAADKFLEGGVKPEDLVEILSDVVRKECNELVSRLHEESLPGAETLLLPEAAVV